jgi:exodeoxyribonuclease V alpha subunit
LQDLLNPEGDRVKGSPFRVGDKIICQKNGWLPARKENAEGANSENRYYVANGEMALVENVEPNRTFAKLTEPDREIIIPRGNASEEDAAGGGEEESGTGCSWDLGYAISTHKAQGSDWKIVIVMIDDYNGAKMVQSRQHIYTSLSRTKELCLLIGRKATALEACKRDALFKRKTFLVERIKELETAVPGSIAVADLSEEFFDELLEGVTL